MGLPMLVGPRSCPSLVSRVGGCLGLPGGPFAQFMCSAGAALNPAYKSHFFQHIQFFLNKKSELPHNAIQQLIKTIYIILDLKYQTLDSTQSNLKPKQLTNLILKT